MGSADVHSTQIYAKIVDRKKIEVVNMVDKKFEKIESGQEWFYTIDLIYHENTDKVYWVGTLICFIRKSNKGIAIDMNLSMYCNDINSDLW